MNRMNPPPFRDVGSDGTIKLTSTWARWLLELYNRNADGGSVTNVQELELLARSEDYSQTDSTQAAVDFLTQLSSLAFANETINDLQKRIELLESLLLQRQAVTLADIGYDERDVVTADNSITLSNKSFSTNVDINVAGQGIKVKEGANARMGTSTLVGGTVTVANTSITANTRVFAFCQTKGGTIGFLAEDKAARVAGTSFKLDSSSATDTSTIAWLLVEPS